MRVNRQIQQTIGINFLTDDQLEELHLATLDVLERVGVEVHEEESLKLLKAEGALVEGSRVRIPPGMIREALLTVPPRVTIDNREGKRAMDLEKRRIYFGTGSDTPNTIDPYSGKRRKSVKKDVINAVKVADEMRNINFVMSMALASDVPEKSADVHHFEAMVLNTDKPILYTAHDREGLEAIFRIAEIVKGGRKELAASPFLALYAEPSSPLSHSRDALEKLLLCAERRLPVIYAPAVMSGATGPVTQAGGIVVANAEILSGLVIHQLKSRGAPFISGGGVPPLDMKTSVCSYGDPRRDLGCGSLVRLAQFYEMPVFTTAGCSDAQVFDQQAGMEAGFNLLMAGLTGGNLIHDLGYIGAGMTYSLEMLVLTNETVEMVKKLLNGYEINAETLALNVIEKVNPGGEYISEEHTYNNFRRELTPTRFLNRSNYDGWLRAGGKSFGQVAREEVIRILERERLSTLAADKIEAIKEVVASREAEL